MARIMAQGAAARLKSAARLPKSTDDRSDDPAP
jgi:hypothetical protein